MPFPLPSLAKPHCDLAQWEHDHTWHPFAQMREFLAYPPLFIERGEGMWLYDTQRRRYLDGNSSLWTNVHGHNEPDLNAALAEQAAKMAHATWLGLSHPTAANLCAALADEAPAGLSRVFFSDNGSNAIEIAIKQSWQYWIETHQPSKREIMGLEGGYHGDTLACMAAGDAGDFHGKFKSFFPKAWHCPRPSHSRKVKKPSVAQSLRALERHLHDRAAHTACFVMEPCLQGSAGMIFHSPEFVREAAALCQRHDVHFILDEIFTGFGRMGDILVCNQIGVTPDFLCLAKGLGGGYLPLAATLTHEKIYAAFLGRMETGNAFIHGHTFTANPLACAVALKSLEKLRAMRAEGLLQARVKSFAACVKATFENHPHVAEMRCGGLAAAIELVPDAYAPHRPYPASARAGLQVCLEARKRGLILRHLGDTLLLVPAPAMTDSEQALLCRLSAEAIAAALDGPERPYNDFYAYAKTFEEPIL